MDIEDIRFDYSSSQLIIELATPLYDVGETPPLPLTLSLVWRILIVLTQDQQHHWLVLLL